MVTCVQVDKNVRGVRSNLEDSVVTETGTAIMFSTIRKEADFLQPGMSENEEQARLAAILERTTNNLIDLSTTNEPVDQRQGEHVDDRSRRCDRTNSIHNVSISSYKASRRRQQILEKCSGFAPQASSLSSRKPWARLPVSNVQQDKVQTLLLPTGGSTLRSVPSNSSSDSGVALRRL